MNTLPPRLSIILGPDPMWRGGLSGPGSVFLHTSRPMILEDASSPLLHELAHTLYPLKTTAVNDWLDEGLAEYMSLTALAASGTISARRYEMALAALAEEGAAVENMLTRHATGRITARAVTLLNETDRELAELTNDGADIYDLALALSQASGPLDFAAFDKIAAGLAGQRLDSISAASGLFTPSATAPDERL
jgi:hypothetical protein